MQGGRGRPATPGETGAELLIQVVCRHEEALRQKTRGNYACKPPEVHRLVSVDRMDGEIRGDIATDKESIRRLWGRNAGPIRG